MSTAARWIIEQVPLSSPDSCSLEDTQYVENVYSADFTHLVDHQIDLNFSQTYVLATTT